MMKKGKIFAPYIIIHGRTGKISASQPSPFALPIYVKLLCHPSHPSLLSLCPSHIEKHQNTQTWRTNSGGVPSVSKEHQEGIVL